MTIKIGDINKLEVRRETDISYTLTDGKDDYFLHFNETNKRLRPGDKVDAFLYYDGKKRLCATLAKPYITTSRFNFVEVVAKCSAGVFVNIGISKDILLSKDFLPNDIRLWPIVGDNVLCILKEKFDQLVARTVNIADIDATPKELEIGSNVAAVVTRMTPNGAALYTKELQSIFVHISLMRKKFRIGEEIIVKIIKKTDNDEYNATCIEQKEIVRLDDASVILNALRTSGGVLQLGNLSSPEDIFARFSMSKGAFKRAVGNLYKQQLIIISDYKIQLTSEELEKI